MKKYYSFLLFALLAVFTACEDVPEPYGINSTSSGTNGLPAGQVLNVSFSSSIGSFSSVNASGNYSWSYQGHNCVQVSSYANNTNYASDAYLVSPKVALENKAYHMTFQYILRYGQAATLATNHTVVISTDYSGNPATATWTKLDFTPVEGSDWNTWASADLAIPEEFQGKEVYIAFHYIGTETKAATWEVKNVIVAEGNVGDNEGGESGGDSDNLINETFASSLGSFKSKAVVGEYAWANTGYSCAQITSYVDNTNNAADAYLVSPKVTMEAEAYHLTFEYILRYGLAASLADNHTVLISTDYNDDPAAATWTKLDFTPVQGSDWKTWTSVDIAIPESFQGKSVVVAFRYVATSEKAATWEIKNVVLAKSNGGGGSETIEGTITVAKALEIAGALADKATSNEVTVAGIISEIKEVSTQYGNAEYSISDDGTTTNQLLVYRGYYLDGAKFTSADQIKVGDKVTITGKLKKWGTTLEFDTGSKIVTLNGEGGGDTPTPSGTATGNGTQTEPYNYVAAANAAKALTSGATSTESYYIKGKISEIKYTFSAQFGTATFFITDDGQKADGQFQVYGVYYLGNRAWVEGDTQIALGDEVVIYGQLQNYNGTPETASKKACLYSLNGTTDGGTPTPTPTPEPTDEQTLADFTNGGFETWTDISTPAGWKSTSTASNATLSQSTVAHSGSYSVRVAGDTKGNKRLASAEMTLEAGTYECSFWTKAATESAASLCPGYAIVGSSVTYMYDKDENNKNKYVNDIAADWQQVTYSFTLSAASSVCIVIMNSKTTGTDLLIDDFVITKK